MAPVVAPCGEDASVPEAYCQRAHDYCRAAGMNAPLCRPRTHTEEARAQGRVSDQSFPDLVDGGFSCNNGGCPVCHGDCDSDDECAPGLICYERDALYNVPPGCRYETLPSDRSDPGEYDSDFCIDPTFRHPDAVLVNSSFWLYVEGEQADEKRDEIWEYDDAASACARIWDDILGRFVCPVESIC